MAFSQISADDVLENIFEDEQSLDESNSEDGKDIYIYGYLGAFVVPRGDLEDESRHLSGSTRLSNVDDDEDEPIDDEDELMDEFAGESNEALRMDCNTEGSCYASGSSRHEDPVGGSQDSEELPVEVVSETRNKNT